MKVAQKLAAILGKRGGLARAKSLSKKERIAHAKLMVGAREAKKLPPGITLTNPMNDKPTVSEQCCINCAADELQIGTNNPKCALNGRCNCHSPTSGVERKNFFQYRADPNAKKLDKDFDHPVEPTAPVGGDWGEELNEVFPMPPYWKPTALEPVYDLEKRREDVKDFIRQTIKNREREIAEGVEGMKNDDGIGWGDEIAGYNKALDDVKAFINKQ